MSSLQKQRHRQPGNDELLLRQQGWQVAAAGNTRARTDQCATDKPLGQGPQVSLYQLEQDVSLLPYDFLLVVLVQVALVILHPRLCVLREV